MGIFKKPDSKFWWYHLEGQKGPGARKNTGVLRDAPTNEQRRDNEKAAQAIYVQRMAQVGLQAVGLVPTTKPTITFRAFMQWVRTEILPQRPSQYRDGLTISHWEPLLGDLLLTAITHAEIMRGRTARLKAGVVEATVNREVKTISPLLALAVPTYLDKNPILGLKKLKEKAIKIRTLTRKEEHRLFRAIGTDRMTRAGVLLGNDCLMRLADVVSLRRDQRDGMRLEIIDPKSGEPYWAHLSRRLVAALDALPRQKGNPYFFASTRKVGGHIARETLVRKFLAACHVAEIPTGRAVVGMTFHCLRHTGATRALDGGTNPKTVMEMGNWASLQQLQRYGHSSDRERQRGVNAISGEGRGRAS